MINVFFFDRLIKDIHKRINKRINKRIRDTYTFNFQSYLLKFYKIKDYTRIEDIALICEKLIFEEFDLVLDLDENIVFMRNVPMQNKDVVKEILKDAQKPLNIREIYKRLVEKYPNYETTTNSISGAMRQSSDFIYFGRTSTYGLKIWEEKYSDIKGGTIRDIVEEFLNEHIEPKHIDEITEYVCQYRDTNAKNIYYNIRMEKNNRFLFFESSYIGLKSKSYSHSITKAEKISPKTKRNTWEESFNLLQKFVEENNEFPRSSGIEGEEILYRFCSVMRVRYRDNKLNSEQIEKLKSINFQFEQNRRKTRKSWFESYEKYSLFIQENNREPDYKINKEKKLYYWKRNSIQSYNAGNLTQKQIELLQKINII